MIFQYTLDLLLSGRKTQTRRRIYPGDRLGRVGGVGGMAVIKINGKTRWVVGKSYAIHRRRGLKAEPGVRVLVAGIRREKDVSRISDTDVRKEGFTSKDAFLTAWMRTNGHHANNGAWVLDLELMHADASAREAVPA